MSKNMFISFDYDHDEILKIYLVGQSKNPNSPFNIKDYSIKEPIPGNWKEDARKRIKSCDVVAVICGEYTDTANGVSAEVQIAQDEKVPYFLLRGYNDKKCYKPKAALVNDKMYNWTWENLRLLINGAR